MEQGGVERGTLEIARALSAAGIPNAVASAGGRLAQKLEGTPTAHWTLPLDTKNPFKIRRNASLIAALAEREGVTLMHVRSRAPAWSVKRASAMTGIPFISTWHGLYGTSPRFLKIPYNRVMISGVHTIAISKCVLEHILSTYGADPSKITLIHRGADTDVFRPDAVDAAKAAAFKKSLGFPEDLKIVTLPGRLTYWKGQKLLLEAAAMCKRRDFGLLFVGSDQGRKAYSDELKAMAARPGMPQTVFLEHTDDMPSAYAASEIVVNASSDQPEAFGRTIPEAQAMGRLVAGAAHGGACETIDDGKTGFLFPPGDAGALARVLERMMSMDADGRKKMADAAARSVRENFSTAAMCEKTLALYKRLHASPSGMHNT